MRHPIKINEDGEMINHQVWFDCFEQCLADPNFMIVTNVTITFDNTFPKPIFDEKTMKHNFIFINENGSLQVKVLKNIFYV